MCVTDDAGDVRITAHVDAHGDVLYRYRARFVNDPALCSGDQTGSVVSGAGRAARDVKVLDRRVLNDRERSHEAGIVYIDV